MKKGVIVIFINIVFANLCSSIIAQSVNDFKLEGTISGKSTGKIYLRYRYKYELINDSSEITNGKFIFRGLINEPVKAELSDNKELFTDSYENYFPNFYIEPKSLHVNLQNENFSKGVLIGSKTNNDFQFLNNSLSSYLNNLARLKMASNPFLKDSILFFNTKIKENALDFVKTHEDSYIAVNAIQQLYMFEEIGSDSCLSMFNGLSEKVKSFHSSLKMKEMLIAEISSKIGKPALDFTRIDANGKTFKLSALKGEYVLLDFWASWCGPCRALSPHIKDLFKKYSSKGLKIVAISCDDKYDDWQEAMKSDSMESFVNILSFSEGDMDFLKTHKKAGDASWIGELRHHFHLMPIPVEILIDNEGVIVGRYGANEKQTFDQLDLKLKTIFEKGNTSIK